VDQTVPHPNYNETSIENDIALLHLSSPLNYNSKVQPIALATVNPPAGSSVTLTGWGYTSHPGIILPINLQQINLQTISIADCQSAHASIGVPVTDAHVCTYVSPGKGACNGDSGGPLVYSGAQVGVVSWGIPCAQGKPDVFTSVAYFRAWITSVSGV